MSSEKNIYDAVLSQKEMLIEFYRGKYKGTGNAQRISIPIYRYVDNPIPDDAANSEAINVKEDFIAFIHEEYLKVIKQSVTITCKIRPSVFKNGFCHLNSKENEFVAFITGEIADVSVIEQMFLQNLNSNDTENAIYFINRKDMAYFESTRDDISLTKVGMNSSSPYAVEARKEMSSGRLEYSRKRNLIVVDPYLEIVFSSDTKVLKVLIDEKGGDTIDNISHFINY